MIQRTKCITNYIVKPLIMSNDIATSSRALDGDKSLLFNSSMVMFHVLKEQPVCKHIFVYNISHVGAKYRVGVVDKHCFYISRKPTKIIGRRFCSESNWTAMIPFQV